MKKVLLLLEVAVVLGLFLIIRPLLGDTPMADWQKTVFGNAPVSSTLLMFVLPLVFILVMRRNPGAAGLSAQHFRYHAQVGLLAMAVVGPATMLFMVVGLIGSDPMQWVGGSILTIGFLAAGAAMVMFVSKLPEEVESILNLKGFLGFVGFLAIGLVAIAIINPLSPLLARMVMVLVFVGFLEEFFFRGYLQSRLNDVFGKPFRLRGVGFGAGLVLAAVIFGLMHPLSALGETTPWAWALWTTAFGLILGYLREKTGSVITPALVHGVLLLPGVLFGAVGK